MTRRRIGLVALCLAMGCSERGRIIHAELPAAPDVKVGAPVRFHGVDIGEVRALTPERHALRAELLITRADAPVRARDRVAVRPIGIFGDVAVDIVPGPDSAGEVGPETVLLAAPADSVAAVRQAVLQAVVKEALEQLGRDSAGTRARPAPRP